MNWKTTIFILSVLVLNMGMTTIPSDLFHIKVKVTDIRNKKGIMQLQVYRNQKTFKAETPYKMFRISKKNIRDGVLYYTIKGIPKGTYGVALLDDENSNKEMDFGLFLPKEGYGFSDYYHTGWSRPTFEDFKFYLSTNKFVKMKVRYH